ncbi:perforin 1 L homeolog precursor [Xenopus laevis]|nr:perforin 1 L homeolog precursor [Xenopus laevis]AAI08843.1 LOC495232 protein [Xenopus laevis]
MLHFFMIICFIPLICSSAPLLHTVTCKQGTKTQCLKASFVPGHNLPARGIDIVTMKSAGNILFNTQQYMKNNTCKLCQDSQDKDKWWKLPRALEQWNMQSSCRRTMVSKVLQSPVLVAKEVASRVQNDWTNDLNLTCTELQGNVAMAGAQSKMVQFAFEKLHLDKYTFLSHKFECEYYSFQMSRHWNLSPHFLKALVQLPNYYNSRSNVQYQQLIASYGTHYITDATMGGQLQEVTALRTCEVALSDSTMQLVKDCREAEIMAAVVGPNNTMLSQICVPSTRKYIYVGNFHQGFNERFREVAGGNAMFDLHNHLSGENKWLKSTEKDPALLNYSLMPIHTLINSRSPKRESLRIALSEYIKKRSLKIECPCSGNTYPSQREDCSCSCSPSKYTNSDCCPTRKGLAKLIIEIRSATGLNGDYFSSTDSYVNFYFNGYEKETETIFDNDDPMWNETLDFGMVELGPLKKYTIEVWDEDITTDNDLLLTCKGILKAGNNKMSCQYSDMQLVYTLYTTCAPYLGGEYCDEYIPSSP